MLFRSACLSTVVAAHAYVVVARKEGLEVVELRLEAFLSAEDVEVVIADEGGDMRRADGPAVAFAVVAVVELAEIVGSDVESRFLSECEVSKGLNSKKVSDHHAIIPTSEVEKADLQKLKEKERNILYLISARVLTATADSYIYETHKCQLTCNFHTFYFNARKTKQEGFQAIEKKLKQFLGVREPEQEAEFDLYLGRNIGPCSTSVSENFTQPPRQ